MILAFTLDGTLADTLEKLIENDFKALIDDVIQAKNSGEITPDECLFILDGIDDDLHAMLELFLS